MWSFKSGLRRVNGFLYFLSQRWTFMMDLIRSSDMLIDGDFRESLKTSPRVGSEDSDGRAAH